MYYDEMDYYIDGGFLANNPCQAAWTEIHKNQDMLDPVLLVSVGCGVKPEEPLKAASLVHWQRLLELMVMLVRKDKQLL